jgi:phosphohistidine phosphatase
LSFTTGGTAVKLILVRHAEAAAIGEAGATRDYDRPLTDAGHAQVAALAAALVGLNVLPSVVYASPLVRSIQTAGPLAAALTPGTPPTPHDLLRLEEMRPRKFAKALNDARVTAAVLVGHMPDLGRFAGWLLGCGATTVAFDKAAAALIACGKTAEKGRGELRWLATPDWFAPAVTSP